MPLKRLFTAVGAGEDQSIPDVESAADAWLAGLAAELENHCAKLTAARREFDSLQERAFKICDDLHRELAESRRILKAITHAARTPNAAADETATPSAAAQAHPTAAPAEHGLPAARLRRVMAYIDASLDEPLTVTTLAGVAGMSRSHFAMLFKRSTGVSPHEAVLRRRVVRATELLREDIQSIAAIGCQLGFSSQAHFTTAFRKRVGLTPSVFRNDCALSDRGGSRAKNIGESCNLVA